MREMAKVTDQPPRSIHSDVRVGNKPSFVDRDAFLTKIGPTEVGNPIVRKVREGKPLIKKEERVSIQVWRLFIVHSDILMQIHPPVVAKGAILVEIEHDTGATSGLKVIIFELVGYTYFTLPVIGIWTKCGLVVVLCPGRQVLEVGCGLRTISCHYYIILLFPFFLHNGLSQAILIQWWNPIHTYDPTTL
jgi:hypothetical protein